MKDVTVSWKAMTYPKQRKIVLSFPSEEVSKLPSGSELCKQARTIADRLGYHNIRFPDGEWIRLTDTHCIVTGIAE